MNDKQLLKQDLTQHDGLDHALLALGEQPGDPWLARRVEAELSARAQAREWLRAHPRGVLSLGAAPLLTRRMASHAGLIIAAGLGGGAVVALPVLAAAVPLPWPALIGTAVCAALAAAAALRWNELRSAFTA